MAQADLLDLLGRTPRLFWLDGGGARAGVSVAGGDEPQRDQPPAAAAGHRPRLEPRPWAQSRCRLPRQARRVPGGALSEVTLHRQPSGAPAYVAIGRRQPTAERSRRGETERRVVAALDARAGRVVSLRRRRLTVAALVRFLQRLSAAYPAARIVVVLDKWPVHFHPDLLAALEPQHAPFPFPRPGN